MPRSKPAPEPERRGHEALKHNAKLAEQFGIVPGADPPRELVHVEHIPTPPDVENPPAPGRRQEVVEAQSEERIVLVIREEMEELGERLARYGVMFNASMKQSMVDYAMSVLGGYVGGGAIARR